MSLPALNEVEAPIPALDRAVRGAREEGKGMRWAEECEGEDIVLVCGNTNNDERRRKEGKRASENAREKGQRNRSPVED
jgi:hypothetical protein